MSANGDYISVVHMDRELITTVSQEFVMQFYTIMNKHPESLHRFYKEESTLIRDDVVAQGQQEIHKYYMNLKLTDCKAIVLSLDAIKSHLKSVLIQVTGEIANNGCDLRRFMQSFVLVEQDLGNFYVLNDIFRYQDQTFKVEETEEQTVEEEVTKEEVPTEVNSWSEISRNIELPVEHVVMQPSIIQEEERKEDFNSFKVSSPEEKEKLVEQVEEKEPMQDLSHKVDDLNVKEKSWAAIINPMGSTKPNKPTVPVAPQPQAVKPVVPTTQPAATKINTNGDSFEKRKPRVNKPQPAPMNYPDENQLFVGNLPQNMNEKELREFFNTYGPVKDVRIQKSRMNGEGKPLPNFGFLVFHSHDVVEEILRNKPIYFNSHRLNVEQKQGNSRSGQNPRR